MATKKVTKAAEVKAVKEVKEVKAVEAPKAEVKAAVEAPKAETKKVEEKKVEKKAPAKKAPAKKAPAKKAEKTTVITVQFQGNEVSTAAIEERVIAEFVAQGHKASEIKTLNVYVKPEEFAAYYVINETETGRVNLF